MRFGPTRVRVYALLALLASVPLFVVKQLNPDTWDCFADDPCRTTTGENLVRSLVMTVLVAVLCLGYELTYRTWVRRRQIRYGDAPQRFAPVPGPARIVLHLGAIIAVVLIAFALGTDHFERVSCSGPDFGGDCDLAELEGLLWAACALLAAVTASITFEIAVARRRREVP